MDDLDASDHPWGRGRRGSDAAPVTLDMLYEGLKHSGPFNPQPVPFETDGFLLIDKGSGVFVPEVMTIHLFITAIRVVMRPDFEYPEWEFEGWLKDDQPVRTWIRGVLRVVTPGNDELDCGLYRLEWGDSPTPGFD